MEGTDKLFICNMTWYIALDRICSYHENNIKEAGKPHIEVDEGVRGEGEISFELVIRTMNW